MLAASLYKVVEYAVAKGLVEVSSQPIDGKLMDGGCYSCACRPDMDDC